MGGVQRNFLSDGIRLGSNVRVDQYQQTNYEMVVSDFIIGNNNNPVLMDMTPMSTMKAESASTITMKKRMILRKHKLSTK